MLEEIDHMRGDTTNDTSDQIDAAERNDSDVKLKEEIQRPARR